MTERSILFSAPMVVAVREDRKTKTRRIAKPRSVHSILGDNFGSGPWDDSFIQDICNRELLLRDAAMRPGDTVWVRENFRLTPNADALRPSIYGTKMARGEDWDPPVLLHYEADGPAPAGFSKKARPSIHMPRNASRLDLLCTDVRVERLHDITEADAIAEGLLWIAPGIWSVGANDAPVASTNPVEAYQQLWVWLNGQASWDENPLVWVYGFKRVAKETETPNG